MSAETDVVAAIAADGPSQQLIGQRLFADVAPSEVPTPYVVYQRVSSEPTATIHDQAPVASRVVIALYTCAQQRAEAEQISNALIVALRQVGVITNRTGLFDENTRLLVSVIELEVWELNEFSSP